MASQSAQVARVCLGDFSLSPKLTSVTHPWSADMLDVTTLADTAKQYVPGLDGSTFSMSGFHDALIDTDAVAWAGVEHPLTWFPFGDAVGNACAITSTLRASYERGAQFSGVVTFDLAAQTTGPTDFGLSLHALGAETASDTGTTLDNGAATSGGAVGSLHVTDYSGFTSITVDVRHSTDNFGSDDVSLFAFTAATGVTGEIKSAAGSVSRYVRVQWTKVGTGSATFAVGFSRR